MKTTIDSEIEGFMEDAPDGAKNIIVLYNSEGKRITQMFAKEILDTPCSHLQYRDMDDQIAGVYHFSAIIRRIPALKKATLQALEQAKGTLKTRQSQTQKKRQ